MNNRKKRILTMLVLFSIAVISYLYADYHSITCYMQTENCTCYNSCVGWYPRYGGECVVKCMDAYGMLVDMAMCYSDDCGGGGGGGGDVPLPE